MTAQRRDLQVWIYPEEIPLAGAKVLARLVADLGLDALSVAFTYHQCLRVLPRHGAVRPGPPGALTFTPNSRRYGKLRPSRASGGVQSNALSALRRACDSEGIGFRAWIVVLDNERLAADNRSHAAQTLDGTPTLHALCPSHEAVRAYAGALVADLVDQFSPDLVDLEAALYPRWNTYVAEIALQPLSASTKLYGAQCFCAACKRMLNRAGIDHTTARRALQAAAGPPLGPSNEIDPPDVMRAVATARDQVIAGLVKGIRTEIPASTRIRLLGFGPLEAVRMQGLGKQAAASADEILVGFGALSRVRLRDHLQAFRSINNLAKTTLALNWSPERSGYDLGRDAVAALRLGVRGLSFYNLSLLPAEGLDALRIATSVIDNRRTSSTREAGTVD